MSPESPVPFGRYLLQRRLAVGGMAEIFLAKQHGPGRFERTLVIKRILPHLAEDQRFVSMFLDEAALAAQLQHPCIAQVYDFGQEQDAYFIALELVRGPDLRSVISACQKTGIAVPPPIAVRMLTQVLAALDYAHHAVDSRGEPLRLVHRDVSPQNVLVSYDGIVKLVDFGVAKAANASTQTEAGQVKGKYSYFAPEQLERAELDGRCDLYAAALVLYELLTLQKAIPGEGPASIAAALEARITPISQLRDDLPPRLVNALGKALKRNREDRFPDCRAMIAELDALLIEWNTSVPAQDIAQFLHTLQDGLDRPLSAVGPGSHPGTASSPRAEAANASDTVLGTVNAPARADPQKFLETVVGEVSSGGAQPTPAPPATVNQAAKPAAPSEWTGEVPKLSRGNAHRVVLGLLAAGALGLAGYFVSQSSEPATPPPAVPLAEKVQPAAANPTAPSPAPTPIAAAPKVEPVSPPALDAGPAATPPAQVAASPAAPAAAPVAPAQPDSPDAAPARPTELASANPPAPREHVRRHAGRAESAAPPSARSGAALASLTVASSPWMEVFVDDKDLGPTPVIHASLSAGSHGLKLVNRALGITRPLPLELAPGEAKKISFQLEKGKLRFIVRPWANVTLDGKPLGATPIDEQQVFEGKHQVVLTNPKLARTISRTVEVSADSTTDVKVDLTAP